MTTEELICLLHQPEHEEIAEKVATVLTMHLQKRVTCVSTETELMRHINRQPVQTFELVIQSDSKKTDFSRTLYIKKDATDAHIQHIIENVMWIDTLKHKYK